MHHQAEQATHEAMRPVVYGAGTYREDATPLGRPRHLLSPPPAPALPPGTFSPGTTPPCN